MVSSDLLGRFAVAVTVGSLALVTVTVVAIARPDVRAALSLAPAPAYVLHARIDVPTHVYESSPYTVLVFARSTCAVCQSSVPFLAKLIREASHSGVAVRLLSAAASVQDEATYAQAIGLDREEVVLLNLKSLRVRRVPTIVLVDQHGEIHYAHEGALPASDQEDLLRRLTSLTR